MSRPGWMTVLALAFALVAAPVFGQGGTSSATLSGVVTDKDGGLVPGATVVVTKSTVPVGTGDEVERLVREANPKADFVVASNPEFLREGAAIEDFKRPDRVVIGIEDPRAREKDPRADKIREQVGDAVRERATSFSTVVLLAAMGIVSFTLIKKGEQKLAPWRQTAEW